MLVKSLRLYQVRVSYPCTLFKPWFLYLGVFLFFFFFSFSANVLILHRCIFPEAADLPSTSIRD